MCLRWLTAIKTLRKRQHTLRLALKTLARLRHIRMFYYSSSSSFALPVHLPRQVAFLVFFSSLFFVSVFGLVLGAFWVPFWLLVGLFFEYFHTDLLITFLVDSGRHSGSIFVPFWAPKSTSGAPGDEKVDLQKPLFYIRKTILFELGRRALF